MIDEPHDALDYQIASHIVSVHMRRDAAFAVPYDMRQVQRYLKYARAFRPEMTPEVRARSSAPEGRARFWATAHRMSDIQETLIASRGPPCRDCEQVRRTGCLACSRSAAGVWRCKPHAQSPTSRPAPCCCRGS